jgi:hypothetical protein
MALRFNYLKILLKFLLPFYGTMIALIDSISHGEICKISVDNHVTCKDFLR